MTASKDPIEETAFALERARLDVDNASKMLRDLPDGDPLRAQARAAFDAAMVRRAAASDAHTALLMARHAHIAEHADAVARLRPTIAALLALGWPREDLSVEHTGGNVYALTLVLKRESGEPSLQAMLGDPLAADLAGGCIEDPRTGEQFESLDSPVPIDDAAAVAAWLTAELRRRGHV